MSQDLSDSHPEYVHLSVRLRRETAEQFKRVAKAEYRPPATELRRMIEQRIAEADIKEAA